MPDFTLHSKMSGTVSNLSEWEVTALMGEEEDVQKDGELVCLNIHFFCVIPQRATGGEFGDGCSGVS